MSLLFHLDLVTIKPGIGVSDKARLKPVFSATETSKYIEISLVASLDMTLSKHRITKAQISLRGYSGWSVSLLFTNTEEWFFTSRPFCGPLS